MQPSIPARPSLPAVDNDDAGPSSPRFTLFAKLPPELRLAIWHLALGPDELRIHVGVRWRITSVDHWCVLHNGTPLCAGRESCHQGRVEGGGIGKKMLYTTDGFFFAPEELGPEYGSEEGGFHWRLGAACREARQAFLERFPQTMAVYRTIATDDDGHPGPYRRVRFNGARDVLVARSWQLRGQCFARRPTRAAFAGFRAALTSFRRLAFVATEQMVFSAYNVFAAKLLFCLAEAAESLRLGAVPHWHRLPDDAVLVDDVNALGADNIQLAHVKKAARRMRLTRHPSWILSDAGADPEPWMLRVRPTPTIGCYVGP